MLLSSLGKWWRSQLEQSQSISLLIEKYRILTKRERLLVNGVFAFVLLLVFWSIFALFLSFVTDIDTNYERAIEDRKLLAQGAALAEKVKSGSKQIISNKNIEAFLRDTMTTEGVVGRISSLPDAVWQITWRNADDLASVLVFADKLTEDGIIIRSLETKDHITLTVQAQ